MHLFALRAPRVTGRRPVADLGGTNATLCQVPWPSVPRAAQLRALFLTETPVTDSGLQGALLACSGLRCLCLEDCARVTPTGLSSLRRGAQPLRGQSLEALNLAAPGLAAADVGDVATALPRLALLHVR